MLDAEHRFQIKKGRNNFFCNRSCSAKFYNAKTRSAIIDKVCPACGTLFREKADCKESTYCSRSCASKSSVTPARRAAGQRAAVNNLVHGISRAADSIRAREGWKYEDVKRYLDLENEPHRFEHPIPHARCVFDLYLPDRSLFIEFDEKYHLAYPQMIVDDYKNEIAKQLGHTVLRIPTLSNQSVDLTTFITYYSLVV
jgi:very-short-patch-repair endonuclease